MAIFSFIFCKNDNYADETALVTTRNIVSGQKDAWLSIPVALSFPLSFLNFFYNYSNDSQIFYIEYCCNTDTYYKILEAYKEDIDRACIVTYLPEAK